MNKLNINFKKSSWKLKKKLDINYTSENNLIQYQNLILYNDLTSLNKRIISTSFENCNLKFSKNNKLLFRLNLQEDQVLLNIIGHYHDLTTPFFGVKKLRRNLKILLKDELSFTGEKWQLDFRIFLYKNCSFNKRKALKDKLEENYYSFLKDKQNIKEYFFSSLANLELEKYLQNSLNEISKNIYKVLCVKSKLL